MSEWQKIETAPKDGTRVILWSLTAGQDFGTDGPPLAVIGNWDNDCWNVPFFDDWCTDVDFTHWMPLPADPTGETL